MKTDYKLISDILRVNPAAMLAGSVALVLQDLKVKNEPRDIDIWIPYDYKFIPLDSMTCIGPGEYNNPSCPMSLRFVAGETKIEIHEGEERESREPIFLCAEDFLIPCCHYSEIIKAKLVFMEKGSPTIQKHKEDILYLLQNNFL